MDTALAQRLSHAPHPGDAFRHGLRARRVLTGDEPRRDFETLRDGLIAEWRPRTATAWLLVDHLTRLHWRLLRAGEAEAERLGRLQTERGYGLPDGATAEAALAWDVGRANSPVQRIQLYEMRLERAVQRTIATLLALRASRRRRSGARRTPPRAAP